MRPIRWVRRGLALASLGAAGGALFVTARHLLTTPEPLEGGLPGEGRIDRAHGGDIYYTVAGPTEDEPIVLLHDFYTGASGYEYGGVFERLARQRRVYAPDWLGFGMSEHPALAYTGEFYAGMLTGFLRDVVARPAIVIANGRAANIAARAASDQPDLFARLVLVSPHADAGLHLDPSLAQALVRAAERTALGLVPYALLSTRPMLRRTAMRRGIGAASEDALDHQHAAAHQFGGHHALLALLTGELDLPLQNVLPLLQPPILLVSGEDDPSRLREDMEDLAVLNPYADLETIPGAAASVFEDQPARFVTALIDWADRVPPRLAAADTLLASVSTMPVAVRPEDTVAAPAPANPSDEIAEEAPTFKLRPVRKEPPASRPTTPGNTTAQPGTASPRDAKPRTESKRNGSAKPEARTSAATRPPSETRPRRSTTQRPADPSSDAPNGSSPTKGTNRPRKRNGPTQGGTPTAGA